MSEEERKAWARLVNAHDAPAEAVGAAEVKAALADLRALGVDVDRYLNPPLRMPEPTPEQKAAGERIAAQIGAMAEQVARAQWAAEEAAIMREMRIVRMTDLLGGMPVTLVNFRFACDNCRNEHGERLAAVLATRADVAALHDAARDARVISADPSPMPINRHRYMGTIAGVPVYVPEQT